MNKSNTIILTLLLCVPGIIISFLIFFLLGSVIFSDECYHESSKMDWFIELMYDFPSWNGMHETPSTFQYVLIVVVGISLSYFTVKKFNERKN